jgi:hypothetical protein
LYFFLAVFAGFVSCSETDETFLKVTNISASKTIAFSLYHSGSGTLQPGQSAYYPDYYTKDAGVESWTTSPVDFVVTPIKLFRNLSF